ncbi:hypothetical protein BDW_03050 [Bdellovibrio bacteriovorus W]|nr:hypothetical protein BDW_03050 [Bdellovibrio bacteriovorus W]
MQPSILENIHQSYKKVLSDIQASCISAQRDPNDVKLMLVSKTVPTEIIQASFDWGHRLFGENKIQELVQKKKDMAPTPIDFHFIGHLQTNKVKECIRYASAIDSVDRMNLVEELDRRLQAEGKSMDILVQVNTSGEESKYGVAPELAMELVRQISKYDTLNIKGLMTLALFSSEAEKVRHCFKVLRELRDNIKNEGIPRVAMDELSMGMSSDYKIAIEEGSTILRVGTAIYGARATPDSYYWPESKG